MKNQVFLLVDGKGATLICDAISKNTEELKENIKNVVFMARKEENILNIVTTMMNHLSCEVTEETEGTEGVFNIYCKVNGKLNILIEGLTESIVFEVKKDRIDFAEYPDFIKVLKKYERANIKKLKEV